jgi:hypothetical protein
MLALTFISLGLLAQVVPDWILRVKQRDYEEPSLIAIALCGHTPQLPINTFSVDPKVLNSLKGRVSGG